MSPPIKLVHVLITIFVFLGPWCLRAEGTQSLDLYREGKALYEAGDYRGDINNS